MKPLSAAEREAVLTEVQGRVLGALTGAPSGARAGRGPADPAGDVAQLVGDSLYHERRRLDAHRGLPGWDDDDRFWREVRARLPRASPEEQRELLGRIVRRYAEEIIGNFDPRVYRVATSVVPLAMSGLLNTLSPIRVLSRFPDLPEIDDHVTVQGRVDSIQRLAEIGTLVLVPTHLSNLDSIVLGYGIERIGLPPFTYGAGLNLFSNPLIGFFMHNLGAYKVDRLKKDEVYKRVLKSYATHTIEQGFHNLFFPGGTRSRSGALEGHLKLGLMGTGLAAYQHNLAARKAAPRVFVVPCTLSYHLVLEAETLIEDSLKEVGKSRYIIVDDEFSQPTRILNFVRNLASLDARIYMTLSEPLDPFGNRVLDDGTSVDARGRPIDIEGYVKRDGALVEDAERDAEYTRELGDAVAATYRRDNVLLSTHLLAHVLFAMCRERRPDLDLYRLLRSGDAHREGFASLDVHDRMERVLRSLARLVERGEVRFGEDGARWDASEVIADGLRHFGVYHTTAAATRRGDRIFPEQLELLLYYSNRVLGYGL